MLSSQATARNGRAKFVAESEKEKEEIKLRDSSKFSGRNRKIKMILNFVFHTGILKLLILE